MRSTQAMRGRAVACVGSKQPTAPRQEGVRAIPPCLVTARAQRESLPASEPRATPQVGASAAIACRAFGPWSCAANGCPAPRLEPAPDPHRTRLEHRLEPAPSIASSPPRNVAYPARSRFFAGEKRGGPAGNRVVFIK